MGFAKIAEALLKVNAGIVVGAQDEFSLDGFSILRACRDSCFVMERNENSLFLQIELKFIFMEENVEKRRPVC